MSPVANVRTLISSAFAAVPRPAHVTKRIAAAMDDEWLLDPERCEQLSALDLEQRWQDLTDRDIEEYCSILPWLDDEALRFYLPAFMDYALRRFPVEDHRAISDIHDLLSSSQEPLRALSADQLRAYQEFEALYGGQT